MTTVKQPSFAGGELGPSLQHRTDTTKYFTSLKTCRNAIVGKSGSALNRPGTRFVAEVKDSTKQARLRPFIFNRSQAYAMEFGNTYIRWHRTAAQVRESAKTITGITQAVKATVAIAAHGYSNGDEVYVSGVAGMTEVNGRTFKVANVAANQFTLQYMNGTDVDSTGFAAYVSGGTAARVYTLASPYAEADLSAIQQVQDADVVTLVHTGHAIRELARLAETSWTLSAMALGPSIGRPNGGAGAAGAAGGKTFRYRVCAVRDQTFEMSLPGREATKSISTVTQANPAKVTTTTNHGYSTGDEVYIEGIVGMTELNGRKFTITVVDADEFTLNGEDSSGYAAYSSGGTTARTYIRIDSAADPTTDAPHTLSWTAVSGAYEYEVYREENGVYGLIGFSGSASFSDYGDRDPDLIDEPARERALFAAAGDYPGAVGSYQNRLCFAGPTNSPETLYGSRPALRTNFNISSPIQADDPVTFSLLGARVAQIRHVVDVGTLVLLNSEGVWIVAGDGSGILRHDAVNARQHSVHGAAVYPAPVVIDRDVLYVDANQRILRALIFDADANGFQANDLTIFAPHLFEGHTIVDMAYQEYPHSVVWVVRDDGVLLGLTYQREHQILAWHRHDTDGQVESVCVIPESNEDRLYMIVMRTINGATKRYIERMETRTVDEDDVPALNFCDCSLSRDGWNSGAETMALTGGTNWTDDETLTLTRSVGGFLSTDVGNEIWFRDSAGTVLLRCEITAYTSGTVVSVRPKKTVPVSLRATASTSWGYAVDELSGLWHLEGKSVSVFADGFVKASPNNAKYAVLTVSSGRITLNRPHVVIHVGLPITSDVETLPIDTPQGEPLTDKRKLISRVTLMLYQTRGIWVGPEPPQDDAVDPLEGLVELKPRKGETYDEPPALMSEPRDQNIPAKYNRNGSVFLRQVDPVPMNVLAILPAGIVTQEG